MDAAEVVEAHGAQVHAIAHRMHPTVVWSHDDMAQEGFIGLLDAHRRHDPRKGKLSTLAQWRIRGQISDAKREIDPVPRSMAAKGVAHGGDVPSLDELSAPDSDTTRGELVADPYASDPCEVVAEEAQAEMVRALVEGLPARDAEVITLYYFGGLSLTVIGDHLGISESRVCQIHRKALRRMRAALR